MEKEVTAVVRQRLHRGRVEIRLDVDLDGTEEIEFRGIDEVRFEAVVTALRDLTEANSLRSPELSDVLEFRPFFEVGTDVSLAKVDAAEVMDVVERALDDLVESRQSEGQGIASDLLSYLDELEEGLRQVEAHIGVERAELAARMKERVAEITATMEAGAVDQERVAREVALLLERGDIAEELQRARSHTEQLRELIAAADGEPLGKKIDFFLQELIRETNTMGSKSQHAVVTHGVVEMKAVVEKMREQAANVE